MSGIRFIVLQSQTLTHLVLSQYDSEIIILNFNNLPLIAYKSRKCQLDVINRPGAAGAVLQTPLSLIK